MDIKPKYKVITEIDIILEGIPYILWLIPKQGGITNGIK